MEIGEVCSLEGSTPIVTCPSQGGGTQTPPSSRMKQLSLQRWQALHMSVTDKMLMIHTGGTQLRRSLRGRLATNALPVGLEVGQLVTRGPEGDTINAS